MSKKSLVPLNVLASATSPTTPNLRAGDLYFNTVDNVLYSYTGSAWVAAAAGGGGGFIAQANAPGNNSLLWIDTDEPSLADGGGIRQIIAGTNITLSPTGGTGVVTINSSGGGGGSASDSDQNILANQIFG